ncbi:tRNA 2-thiouridine(34) synthase MnmA [Candidatus Kaiserbacteria bacterium]|nr:tRNA 2-thiouridine(34) synthase MnmA [Candidatus Kaiserbacteria bacterium]
MSSVATVFVGLSGGVDSSVAAARLARGGYAVVGVFIKVWQPPFLRCDWEKERLDAMRVCATLGIPFLTCDAQERYKVEVADYLVREYKAGRTPNPDVMCNKYIKFGAFLDFADEHGADFIATGHYARRAGSARAARKKDAPGISLLRGVDASKDQSYFLWTLTQAQLSRTLFPIGDTLKSDIRREAAKYGLPTAEKPDSQGVCFLGELDMKEFLFHFIPRETGEVRDETGTVVGEHDGAVFYTVGQRHGFRLHQTDPNEPAYYVVAKDRANNVLVVSHEKPALSPSALRALGLSDTSWVGMPPRGTIEIQIRYRQKPVPATVEITGATTATVTPLAPLDLPAAGQSCVVYDGDTCLGGGIVDSLT